MFHVIRGELIPINANEIQNKNKKQQHGIIINIIVMKYIFQKVFDEVVLINTNGTDVVCRFRHLFYVLSIKVLILIASLKKSLSDYL